MAAAVGVAVVDFAADEAVVVAAAADFVAAAVPEIETCYRKR